MGARTTTAANDTEVISSSTVISVSLNTGGSINLRPYTTKFGNIAWGVLARKADGNFADKPTSYGLNVSETVIGGSTLPTSATVLGVVVPLVASVKDVKDKKGTVIGQRNEVKGSATVSVNGKDKAFELRISQPDGKFNVAGSIRGIGGGGGKLADET